MTTDGVYQDICEAIKHVLHRHQAGMMLAVETYRQAAEGLRSPL